MSEGAEKIFLYSAKPSLIREWHPTKNGSLTPRNLTSDYDKNIWWLCEQGHEWEAPVKDRISDEECPICELEMGRKEVEKNLKLPDVRETSGMKGTISRKTYRDLKIDTPDKYSAIEYRKFVRYKYKVAAILENPISGDSIYAQMQNISEGGMHLVTNMELKKGERIHIKFGKPPIFTKAKLFKSDVRWCKEMFDDKGHAFGYGLGMKFI